MTSPVLTIEAEVPLDDARALMQRQKIHHVPVMQGSALVGLITNRELRQAESALAASRIHHADASRLEPLLVKDVMTRQVVTITPTVPAHEAARLVWQGQTTYCLVVQEGQLLGIVTTTDLLDLFIDLITAQLPATYEHILVPIDFTPAAAPAIDAALALARGQRARLILIHVLPRLNSRLSADMDHVPAEVITQLTEECRADVLRRLATLIPPDVQVPVIWQAVEGEPAAAIVKTAIRLKADLIVMGRRNRHGLRRLFIPSVARQVIRCAPCPVLVVEGTGAWLSRTSVSD